MATDENVERRTSNETHERTRTTTTMTTTTFERDGKPLDDAIGPFRLVVPTDKRGARWVRQVTRIRIVKPQ